MKELREIQFEDEPFILKEETTKDGDTMDVLVPWIQWDKKNENDRFYPKALLQREVAKVQGAVKSGAFLGTGDHPAGGVADIATASHIIKKVFLDKKGKGWTELKVIPTTRGKNIMTLIRQGAQLGISARGMGNVDEKTGEVQSDYKLLGIDIVTSPSYKEGVFNKDNIYESLKLEDKLKESLSPEINSNEEKMKLEDLKKDNPELVKQIEDEKAAALKVETDKIAKVANDKVTDLEEKVKTLGTEKTAFEEEIKGLKEKITKYVSFLRDSISSAGAQEDVLDDESGDTNPNTEPKDEDAVKESKKIKESLKEAVTKIEALETKDKERTDAVTAEEKAAELQTQLRTKLDEVLAIDGYKGYVELIEDEVVKDGKIDIKSVEAVEDSVKAAFEHINKLRSADVKAKILKDTKEKGHIPSPEDSGAEEDAEKKLMSVYEESVRAGYKKKFDEWKKEFPKIVESVS